MPWINRTDNASITHVPNHMNLSVQTGVGDTPKATGENALAYPGGMG